MFFPREFISGLESFTETVGQEAVVGYRVPRGAVLLTYYRDAVGAGVFTATKNKSSYVSFIGA